jgi:16S rRNA (guanine966-N2)-methyltransferase
VVRADVHSWVTRDGGSYDLIFVDPPYAKYPTDRDHLKELFAKGALADRLAEGGLLIAEQSIGEAVREGAGLIFLERREYGSSAILLYAKAEAS